MSYIVNPRVTENRVGDGTNVKKSQTEYWADSGVATYGLVKESRVYDTDLSTVLKKSVTEYNLSSTYTNRRIIGLPSKVEVYGREASGLNLMSKVTYTYDEGDFSNSSLVQNISPTQHDNTNYSASFVAGRGNLTSTTRWNVEYPTTSGYAVSSSMKYNTAGSPVSQITPWDGTSTREVKIAYIDNFNSSGNPTTYAYPTTLTDPNSQSSTVKYRYDIGANIEANSPAPAGQTYGKTSKRWIDSYGRLEKEAVLVNGAEQYYTRREFPTNGVQSKTYSTIVDTNISTNPGPDSADEVYSESWSDGAGRMRMSRTEHPGSTGGWTASQVEYDLLGRVKRQSVPTEVSVSGSTWTPSGDDATRGWLWTYQKYDWKGRVVRKINTDGADSSTLNDSDVLISYEGCGCAGGQVTTIESERVPIPNTTNYARRKQKIYEDILGRGYKTEVYQWDGTTLYTTTEQTFNGRDQVVNTRQTDNTSTASPQTHQDVTMTYDGFGRMKTRHYPIEDSAAATTWNYNPDGSIAQIVDPRNAITDLTYNNRGLTTQIAYTPASGSSMPDAPTVNFGYDALGNRTSMDTAGVSETTYSYNSLSQMTSETVNFDDLSNDLTIGYTYNLSGGLSSVTDPFGESVDYTNDRTGRLTAVGGTPFGDNPTGDYASGIQYRAFGQVKQMTYETDDNAVVSMQYDNRLRVSQHQVASGEYSGGYLKKAEFVYYSDSKPKEMDDQVDAVFDRKFEYDFAGRLSRSEFGLYTTQQNTQINPHMQDVAYDAFSQVTSRETEQWGSASSFGRTYVNGRMAGYSGETLTYDAAGNITYTGVSSNKFQDTVYDAAGRRSSYTERWIITGSSNSSIVSERVLSNKFDGAGQLVKSTNQLNRISSPSSTGDVTNTYTVHSSVLGGALSEISYVGESVIKRKTSIYAGGAIIAEQRRLLDDDTVVYFHADPVTGSKQEVRQTGESIDTRDGRQEVEPFGQSIRTTPPFEEEPPANPVPIVGDSLFPEWQCALPADLIPTHCALKMIADIKGGGLWLGPTSTKNKEGNIANLSHESSHSDPGRGGVALAANNALSAAVSATTKPVRTDGPEDCPKDENGKYSALCNVNSDGPDVDDFVDASGEGDVVPVALPSNIRQLVETRLNATQPGQTINCNEFMAKVIAKVVENSNAYHKAIAAKAGTKPYQIEAAGNSGIDILGKVKNIVLEENVKVAGRNVGGTIRGSINGGDATVVLNQAFYLTPVERGSNPVLMFTNAYVDRVIHELSHLAHGAATDGALARAAFQLGYSTLDVKDPNTNDIDQIMFDNSPKWSTVLKQYCGGN